MVTQSNLHQTENSPQWIKSYLSDIDLKNIEQAVAKAELTTSAEIVPMVVSKSSTTGHIRTLLFLLLLSITWGAAFYIDDFSLQYKSGLFLGLPPFCYGIALLLSGSRFLQRHLISSSDQAHQVQMRAINEFYQLGLENTKARTGILIFASLLERQAVILADKAISEKVSGEVWDDAIDLLLGESRQGQLSRGFILAIEYCQKVVTKDFPITSDNSNELRNRLIIKD